MRGRPRRINTSVMACLALLGGAGVGGLAAGFNARASLPTGPSSTVSPTLAEMPPSETVNLRFPANWTEAAGEPAPRTLAFASADGGITLFNPRSFSPIAEAHAAVAPTATEAPVKAKPSTQAAAPASRSAAEAAPTGPAKIALASASSKPAAVAPKPAPRSNAVLNESQIAGLKKRLALTPDQKRYSTAVEAELRKMEYSKKSPQSGSRMAFIDIRKIDVER